MMTLGNCECGKMWGNIHTVGRFDSMEQDGKMIKKITVHSSPDKWWTPAKEKKYNEKRSGKNCKFIPNRCMDVKRVSSFSRIILLQRIEVCIRCEGNFFNRLSLSLCQLEQCTAYTWALLAFLISELLIREKMCQGNVGTHGQRFFFRFEVVLHGWQGWHSDCIHKYLFITTVLQNTLHWIQCPMIFPQKSPATQCPD